MKNTKLNQTEIERISEATGKRMFDIMREIVMENKNETAARGNEISVLTKYKILAICKTGAKRDIFSPSELKGIERFLGVNARPKAAQEVPR